MEEVYRRWGEVHWTVFLAAFALLALWETYRPARAPAGSTPFRWAGHASLLLAANFILSFAQKFATAGVATASESAGPGAWQAAHIPYALRFVAAILLLDLTRYLSHLLLHSVSFLWRVHRVHHSDADFDVTTAVRFHPFESVVMQGIYLVVIAALAPPLLAVLLLEMVTVCQVQLIHCNVDMPAFLECILRPVLITQPLHRIHHSQDMSDQNTNFGTLFPWWDRMFGTYREAPLAGSENLRYGLPEVPPSESAHLLHLYLSPFREASAPSPKPVDDRIPARY